MDARPVGQRRRFPTPSSRHPAMSKKKSKGVLETIGDAVSSGAEAVVDAGSKAIHSVGDMMPAPKKAAKAKAHKPAAKVARPAAKASTTKTKSGATKAETKVSKPAEKGAGAKTGA